MPIFCVGKDVTVTASSIMVSNVMCRYHSDCQPESLAIHLDDVYCPQTEMINSIGLSVCVTYQSKSRSVVPN